jgi:hypothetical protein
MKKLSQDEKELLEDNLIDAVIGNIKEDLAQQDVEAMFELLRFAPVPNLIAYLQEEKWPAYDIVYADYINKQGMRLEVTPEYTAIYHKHEEVVGWGLDELQEDYALVSNAMSNAIKLAKTDIMALRSLVGKPLRVGSTLLSDAPQDAFVQYYISDMDGRDEVQIAHTTDYQEVMAEWNILLSNPSTFDAHLYVSLVRKDVANGGFELIDDEVLESYSTDE